MTTVLVNPTNPGQDDEASRTSNRLPDSGVLGDGEDNAAHSLVDESVGAVSSHTDGSSSAFVHSVGEITSARFLAEVLRARVHLTIGSYRESLSRDEPRSDQVIALPLTEARRIACQLPYWNVDDGTNEDFDAFMFHAGHYYARGQDKGVEFVAIFYSVLNIFLADSSVPSPSRCTIDSFRQTVKLTESKVESVCEIDVRWRKNGSKGSELETQGGRASEESTGVGWGRIYGQKEQAEEWRPPTSAPNEACTARKLLIKTGKELEARLRCIKMSPFILVISKGHVGNEDVTIRAGTMRGSLGVDEGHQ
ncbi:hypothetical protein GY45DRAFT_1341500 [Cubamyces sp. BRFM 1775]|nr:hypothetical protein GY45DRAFT_1341500 [Cubamyces sp. BRFM 1775]